MFFFITPRWAFAVQNPAEFTRLTLFTAEGLALTALTAAYRKSQLAAIQAKREAIRTTEILQRRLRAVFEENPVGLALVDRDLGVFRCNGAFAKVCRASRTELENSSLAKFIEPATAARLSVDIAVALDAPHGTIKFETPWSIGGVTSVSGRLVSLPDPDGKAEHVGLLCEDISERLRTQAELQQSQAMLRQAEKMEAVGRLAGGVAHDFNNLLAVIIGYAGMLVKRFPEADPRRADVQEIGKAAERAATLTRQLLAFSRKQVNHPEVVNLNDIVGNTSSLLRRIIGEHIELEVSLEPNLGPVFVDRSQMELVLLNLAANSRDAMPNGGLLTIRTANAAAEQNTGERISLIVADTGIGIEEETKLHIFEPFFTTKEVGKGTGLGLSTVYGIVKQSQGDIAVDSMPGAGTKFTIWLPRASQSTTAKPSTDQNVPASGSGIILVVEDEEGLRTLLARVLQNHGFRVLTALNGDDALALAERQAEPANLLLTDVVMPGLSGATLAERLRQKWPGMRVLFMSGHTPDTQHAIAGYVAQGNFLPKPFTPDTVIRRVTEILNSRSDGA